MLNIKVWCLPPMEEPELIALYEATLNQVISIPAFYQAGYTSGENILILFPADLMKKGLGKEILIEVRGLDPTIEALERAARGRLASNLSKLYKEKFPDSRVACWIFAFNLGDVESTV